MQNDQNLNYYLTYPEVKLILDSNDPLNHHAKTMIRNSIKNSPLLQKFLSYSQDKDLKVKIHQILNQDSQRNNSAFFNSNVHNIEMEDERTIKKNYIKEQLKDKQSIPINTLREKIEEIFSKQSLQNIEPNEGRVEKAYKDVKFVYEQIFKTITNEEHYIIGLTYFVTKIQDLHQEVQKEAKKSSIDREKIKLLVEEKNNFKQALLEAFIDIRHAGGAGPNGMSCSKGIEERLLDAVIIPYQTDFISQYYYALTEDFELTTPNCLLINMLRCAHRDLKTQDTNYANNYKRMQMERIDIEKATAKSQLIKYIQTNMRYNSYEAKKEEIIGQIQACKYLNEITKQNLITDLNVDYDSAHNLAKIKFSVVTSINASITIPSNDAQDNPALKSELLDKLVNKTDEIFNINISYIKLMLADYPKEHVLEEASGHLTKNIESEADTLAKNDIAELFNKKIYKLNNLLVKNIKNLEKHHLYYFTKNSDIDSNLEAIINRNLKNDNFSLPCDEETLIRLYQNNKIDNIKNLLLTTVKCKYQKIAESIQRDNNLKYTQHEYIELFKYAHINNTVELIQKKYYNYDFDCYKDIMTIAAQYGHLELFKRNYIDANTNIHKSPSLVDKLLLLIIPKKTHKLDQFMGFFLLEAAKNNNSNIMQYILSLENFKIDEDNLDNILRSVIEKKDIKSFEILYNKISQGGYNNKIYKIIAQNAFLSYNTKAIETLKTLAINNKSLYPAISFRFDDIQNFNILKSMQYVNDLKIDGIQYDLKEKQKECFRLLVSLESNLLEPFIDEFNFDVFANYSATQTRLAFACQNLKSISHLKKYILNNREKTLNNIVEDTEISFNNDIISSTLELGNYTQEEIEQALFKAAANGTLHYKIILITYVRDLNIKNSEGKNLLDIFLENIEKYDSTRCSNLVKSLISNKVTISYYLYIKTFFEIFLTRPNESVANSLFIIIFCKSAELMLTLITCALLIAAIFHLPSFILILYFFFHIKLETNGSYFVYDNINLISYTKYLPVLSIIVNTIFFLYVSAATILGERVQGFVFKIDFRENDFWSVCLRRVKFLINEIAYAIYCFIIAMSTCNAPYIILACIIINTLFEQPFSYIPTLHILSLTQIYSLIKNLSPDLSSILYQSPAEKVKSSHFECQNGFKDINSFINTSDETELKNFLTQDLSL